ncbi:terpene synthase family protein [Cryptosporangium japonicum]|uniref:Terpene synthase n=1 Tax=Cryptosporangium japonicum TaxID=80872 RepID=A0ABN0U7Z6_9ACTN
MTTTSLATTADSARTAVRVVRLLRALRRWAAGIDPRFAAAVEIDEVSAMVLVEAGPRALTGELLAPAMTAVWMQVADDHVDRVTHDQPEFDAVIRRWRSVAAGAGPTPGDPLEAALADLVRRLRTSPRYPSLFPLWRRSFGRMLDAWVFEQTTATRLARGEPAPGLDAYLAQHHSFGLRPIVLAWWVTAGGDDLPDALDVLLAALDEIELAVRLANDLLMADRERTEPGSVDAVLLGADAAWIGASASEHLRRGHDLLEPLLANGSPTGEALGRIGEWLVTFYLMTDARLA